MRTDVKNIFVTVYCKIKNTNSFPFYTKPKNIVEGFIRRITHNILQEQLTDTENQ